ncbi:hypothetical protein ACE01N_20090 [Saccharicrinis sp. FJH2]|uniref:hypothetical protein n=1 Tax=Saccharicrinis sp. FJH65 TaxID=3344659 RepID=UPI0035F433D4
MRNFYYIYWADAIQRIRKHHPKKKDWKISLYVFNSWIHALNLFIIFLWLKYFHVLNIALPDINIFPGDMIDGFLSFAIVFATPFFIINYFLIFYKDRYKKIVDKYHIKKGNYAMPYSMVIALGAFISAITYSILT